MEAMPDAINRRCPRCGRKAHDRLIVQCPDCRVPFEYEDLSSSGLTPEQLGLVISQIFSSWKFWAVLLCLIGVSAWGVVKLADRMIDTRAKAYMATLQQEATNNINAAAGQISNQIVLQFRSPKIKSVIEQAAREHALDIFAKGVQPTLDTFQEAIDLANNQLARQAATASNSIARIQADLSNAQRRIPPPTIAFVPTNPPAPAVVIAPVPMPIPAAPADNNPTESGVHLILSNHSIVPAGNHYLLTLFFTKTAKSDARGTVEIDAATWKLTARIVSFASMSSGPTQAPVINDSGDIARLNLAVNDREAPTVVMELSAPTIVRIVSDSFDVDQNQYTLPVAAEKMQLPAPGR